MRRLTALFISATLASSVLLTAGATPAGACKRSVSKADVFHAMRTGSDLDAGIVRTSSGMESVALLTFNLELADTKKTYRIGDVVPIDVTVTRPAKEDPLGNGIPMERPYVEPVAGAIVGVGLYIGRVFLPGGAITDADGVARVRIKLAEYAPAGKLADASVYSWKSVYETPCASVQEYGYRTVPGMLRTTR